MLMMNIRVKSVSLKHAICKKLEFFELCTLVFSSVGLFPGKLTLVQDEASIDFFQYKLLVIASLINDFVKQIVPTTNMPSTATMLAQSCFSKALPLLRLPASRWVQ